MIEQKDYDDSKDLLQIGEITLQSCRVDVEGLLDIALYLLENKNVLEYLQLRKTKKEKANYLG